MIDEASVQSQYLEGYKRKQESGHICWCFEQLGSLLAVTVY